MYCKKTYRNPLVEQRNFSTLDSHWYTDVNKQISNAFCHNLHSNIHVNSASIMLLKCLVVLDGCCSRFH